MSSFGVSTDVVVHGRSRSRDSLDLATRDCQLGGPSARVTRPRIVGALLETFVVNQVIKQAGWSSLEVEPYHFRTADGAEVDLVLEATDRRVAAVEVKAGSRVTPSATAGLTYLRDKLGDRFAAGVVFNTGQHAQRLGDRLAVAPIDSLWS